jgi:hypothetical protein
MKTLPHGVKRIQLRPNRCLDEELLSYFWAILVDILNI